MKKARLIPLYLLFYLGFFILISYQIVEVTTRTKLYDSPTAIPKNEVGLLLGTSKYLRGGYINLFYKYRIQAAVTLYKQGKIKYILISGDNGTKHYNEPMTMKKDLVKAGIPVTNIYLDYAGFRTLDSVVRSREIFGQQSITIISQPFHNKRAIFIALHKGIDAVGYNAQKVSKRYGFKTRVREVFARCKMVIDLLFGKMPKFLGKEVPIPTPKTT